MNVAIAGFAHGHVYSFYEEAQSNDEITLLGCFEEDETRRQMAEKRIGKVFCYNSYEEIIKDSRVDIVAIAGCFSKRGAMVIAALKAGKHVLCDKPLCTRMSEIDEIIHLAKSKNLKVGAMMTLRLVLPLLKAREIAESGEIGEIVSVSFTGQHCLDYKNRDKWFFEEGKHGGTINDLGIHGLDAVRFVTGKNLSKINAAKTWNAFAKEAPDFCDCAQFLADMEGMSVMTDVSYSAPKCSVMLPTYWNFCFWGTEGMMNFNYKEKKIHLYKNEEKIIEHEPFKISYFGELIREIKGEPSLIGADDVLKSQKQILEIQGFANSQNK